MRTTVELPPALLRAAKTRAARRGETLKALLTRAVENELSREPTARRVEWPLIRSSQKTKRRLTNADLEDILMADDADALRRSQR